MKSRLVLAITGEALDKLRVLRFKLECLILKIPTGEIRNALCDANIHMAEAETLMLKKLRYENSPDPISDILADMRCGR